MFFRSFFFFISSFLSFLFSLSSFALSVGMPHVLSSLQDEWWRFFSVILWLWTQTQTSISSPFFFGFRIFFFFDDYFLYFPFVIQKVIAKCFYFSNDFWSFSRFHSVALPFALCCPDIRNRFVSVATNAYRIQFTTHNGFRWFGFHQTSETNSNVFVFRFPIFMCFQTHFKNELIYFPLFNSFFFLRSNLL